MQKRQAGDLWRNLSQFKQFALEGRLILFYGVFDNVGKFCSNENLANARNATQS